MNSHLDIEIYKRIVENISEGVWICDQHEKTTYTNQAFLGMTGYSKKEITGKHVEEIWDGQSHSIIKKNIHTKEVINSSHQKAIILSKDKKLLHLLCNWTSLPGGGTMALITDLREINTLKDTEENLTRLNRAKDEFISIVGHELRTPLSSIKGYLSMILDGDMGEVNLDIRKALNHSYDSSIRLIKLVNNVLSLGKIESGKMEYHMENINVIDMLKSVYKDTYMEIEDKKIEFKIDFNEKVEGVEIYADSDKLKQVFLNLITNARKFTDPGGKITLRTRKLKDTVRFEIIDTGEGIRQEDLDKLFQKFSQIESTMQRQNTSGIGLGLALCKNFIEKFGSDIKVKSEYGKGSKFYFDLPISE